MLGPLPAEKLPKEDLRLYSTFLLTFIISAVMLSQKDGGEFVCYKMIRFKHRNEPYTAAYNL